MFAAIGPQSEPTPRETAPTAAFLVDAGQIVHELLDYEMRRNPSGYTTLAEEIARDTEEGGDIAAHEHFEHIVMSGALKYLPTHLPEEGNNLYDQRMRYVASGRPLRGTVMGQKASHLAAISQVRDATRTELFSRLGLVLTEQGNPIWAPEAYGASDYFGGRLVESQQQAITDQARSAQAMVRHANGWLAPYYSLDVEVESARENLDPDQVVMSLGWQVLAQQRQAYALLGSAVGYSIPSRRN